MEPSGREPCAGEAQLQRPSEHASREGRTIRVWRVLAIRKEIRNGGYPLAQVEREAIDRLIDRILVPRDSSERRRDRRAAR
ncbi:MAG: hypothetical protein HRU75_03730 [Planctomycetia bacterium]|nr:MAG: hypothetical protein HRU75_03730 [Planctomycetia bacterium]